MMEPSEDAVEQPHDIQSHTEAPQRDGAAVRLSKQEQGSPVHVRKLGRTRKLKAYKEDENPEETERRHREQELKPLYRELLYTILYRVGKPRPHHVSDEADLVQYIKQAFSMTQHEHNHLLQKVQSLEPPVNCLMVTVKEAKGILGKDVSGFSDPYCMLAIMYTEDVASDNKKKGDTTTLHKPKKAVVKNAIPDEEIYQTEVKKQTLNPNWNETFILEVADPARASFHMEMWDKDEDVTLGQKLEEFRTNFQGFKRMLKEVKKEKGQDDFLGNVALSLQNLHYTEDEWYTLEPRTETYPDRGKCHMQLKFIHKERDGALSAGRSAYVNYCGILQQFVQYDISQKQDGSATWKGELSKAAQTLLDLHATQNDLSPFLQDLAKWVAYSRLNQKLELDPTVLFQQLTSIEYHWGQQELPFLQKQELAASLHDFLQYGLSLVSKYRDVFLPTATKRLHTLLRVMVQICKTKAFQKLNPSTFDLQQEVTKAVQVGTQEWFTIKKGLHQPMMKDVGETIKALAGLVNELQEDVKLNKDVWNKVFISAVQLDVFTVIYVEQDTLIAAEIDYTLSSLGSQIDQQLANTLYPLYLSLKAIHKEKAFLQKRGKLLALTEFHVRFRDALPHWLNKAYNTTLERVQRAVQVDQLQPLLDGSVPIKHSSSAVDLAACLQPISQMWNDLSWPDPEEAFMLMVKLTEDICKIALTYCRMVKQRAEELSDKSDHSHAVNKLCVVVNNMEHLRTILNRLPEQLNWAGLRETTKHVIREEQFHNTLPSQLQHAQGVLGKQIRTAVETLGQQLRADIEKHILNMAAHRRYSSSTEDAVVPLMRYLEKELHYMNENLVQENFNSLLAPLWANSVKIIDKVSQQQNSVMEFYQRLHYTLQCLEQCFHAEGNGLHLETLHTAEYKELKAHLTLHSLSTQQLIEKFLEQKVWEQKSYTNEKYGAVTLIGSYKKSDQRLHIEVLNAVNLIPLDSNGSSDPFVHLSLEPRHLFPEVEARSTKIKKSDLNPLFEEAFEFLVSVEQCHTAGACLVITVLDHDTLRADDFEGEAFLSLRAIPGIGSAQDQPGTPQIRLPLMHPKPNVDKILRLLEVRKSERDAQAFVKLRKQREKKSKEV
uniref:Unc-13 homolog D n=1 Tax=Lepisosteus oculatus TaxID=7918 RepID=W5N0V5_LEPOC|nr:PREDICTED: protein unc-13 homolog D isoform X1 [Lepisosteus oculatus]XP_015211558.1 PREDICTED: protein unc-13 homolog D isoform X1 [Lepisosteus oculatus]